MMMGNLSKPGWHATADRTVHAPLRVSFAEPTGVTTSRTPAVILHRYWIDLVVN